MFSVSLFMTWKQSSPRTAGVFFFLPNWFHHLSFPSYFELYPCQSETRFTVVQFFPFFAHRVRTRLGNSTISFNTLHLHKDVIQKRKWECFAQYPFYTPSQQNQFDLEKERKRSNDVVELFVEFQRVVRFFDWNLGQCRGSLSSLSRLLGFSLSQTNNTHSHTHPRGCRYFF